MKQRFFTKSTSWTNLELGIIKISLISFGIITGHFFSDLTKSMLPGLWVVFIITAGWMGWAWRKKSNEKTT